MTKAISFYTYMNPEVFCTTVIRQINLYIVNCKHASINSQDVIAKWHTLFDVQTKCSKMIHINCNPLEDLNHEINYEWVSISVIYHVIMGYDKLTFISKTSKKQIK